MVTRIKHVAREHLCLHFIGLAVRYWYRFIGLNFLCWLWMNLSDNKRWYWKWARLGCKSYLLQRARGIGPSGRFCFCALRRDRVKVYIASRATWSYRNAQKNPFDDGDPYFNGKFRMEKAYRSGWSFRLPHPCALFCAWSHYQTTKWPDSEHDGIFMRTWTEQPKNGRDCCARQANMCNPPHIYINTNR